MSKIKQATMPGVVTLTTKLFGRGTDFPNDNDQVNSRGGVQVICAFIPSSECEWEQIKGRTARYGSNGGFSMVLLETEVKKVSQGSNLPLAVSMNELIENLKS